MQTEFHGEISDRTRCQRRVSKNTGGFRAAICCRANHSAAGAQNCCSNSERSPGCARRFHASQCAISGGSGRDCCRGRNPAFTGPGRNRRFTCQTCRLAGMASGSDCAGRYLGLLERGEQIDNATGICGINQTPHSHRPDDRHRCRRGPRNRSHAG